jgi:hypothetical protein
MRSRVANAARGDGAACASLPRSCIDLTSGVIASGEKQVSKMGYLLAPNEVNITEAVFAEFRICNDQGEPIATFGFA